MNRSDLYFVCLLTPLTNEIKIQEDEIAEAKWMPVRNRVHGGLCAK